MKQVIVFPRGQLNSSDKERLSKAGMVAVEADDPSKVICLLPSTSVISADDLFMSAITAVSSGTNYNKADMMITELFRRAKLNESKKDSK
jgi:hypothetical protein